MNGVTPHDICTCVKCGPPWREDEPDWCDDLPFAVSWMPLCPVCGDKRCPGAINHDNHPGAAVSKPRIIAQYDVPSHERRVLCQPSPVSISPSVEVRVEFDKGDHERALSRLRSAVGEVERQIAESHAPTWDGPGKVGEE